MEIGFADTFGDSIKNLIRHNTWWYKTYSLFRYDIPRFIKNVWRFRKPLANHYWWDHHSSLQFLEISLLNMSDNLEKHGNEIDLPRFKKVAAMRRAIELIRNYNEDLYIEMAEAELGEVIHYDWEFEDIEDKPGYSRLVEEDTPEERKHNKKVFDRVRQIEENEWDELFKILKGQDYKEYRKLVKLDKKKEIKNDNLWDEWFDGSGLNGWWD